MHLAIKEAQDRDELHSVRFGPLIQNGQRVSFKESRIDYMEKVDTLRSDEVYHHEQCSADCKKRGCGRLYVADGCWKLHYAICMYNVPTEKGTEKYLPNVCTRAPMTGQAFCSAHCKELESDGIPTGLRPFIKSCGANPENYSKDEKKKVEEKLKVICKRTGPDISVPEVQGTRLLYANLALKVLIE